MTNDYGLLEVTVSVIMPNGKNENMTIYLCPKCGCPHLSASYFSISDCNITYKEEELLKVGDRILTDFVVDDGERHTDQIAHGWGKVVEVRGPKTIESKVHLKWQRDAFPTQTEGVFASFNRYNSDAHDVRYVVELNDPEVVEEIATYGPKYHARPTYLKHSGVRKQNVNTLMRA